jgi:hypothetical protein
MKLRILTVLVLSTLLSTTASAQYERTDLVSNQPGVAPTTDPRLVNAWGLVALPTSPWWVSDNSTGFSTLYTGTGQQVQLFVTVPPAPAEPAGTLGTPTGIVGNLSTNATDFTVTENGMSGQARFIFATLDRSKTMWPGHGGVSRMLPARTGRFLLQSPGQQGLCTDADAGLPGCRCFPSAGCRQSISRGAEGATSSSVG